MRKKRYLWLSLLALLLMFASAAFLHGCGAATTPQVTFVGGIS